MSVDISDGLLLDVTSLSLDDLPLQDDDSALGRALRRVIESNSDIGYAFNSSI